MSGNRVKMFAVIAALVLGSAVFPFLAGIYPTVRFPREYIDIHVFPRRISVEARYVYRNPFPFPVAQGFYYPLPIDDRHPAPEGVYAEELVPSPKFITVRHLFGRHVFEKRFWGNEESTVRVIYEQPCPDGSGTYIITTTKDWRRPLEYALYRIFPHGVRIMTSNYELTNGGNGILSFERRGFMPEEDWRFSWEPITLKGRGGES